MKKNSMRLLGFLLAAVMMVSLFGLGVFAEDTANDVNAVDGNDAAGTVDVQNSEADLVINSVDELLNFAESVNSGDTYSGKIVALGSDLDLAGLNWTPIGNDTNYFCGNFDGQDHIISNMTINVNTPDANQFVGLFGGVKKATIKNLTMTNVNIDVVGAKVRAAAVVGIAHSNSENRTDAAINFENITVNGCTINAQSKSGSALIGGVVGYCYPANLANINVSGLTIDAKADGSNEVRAAAILGYLCGQNISNNGNTRAAMLVDTFNVENVSITADAYTVFAGGYAPYTYYGYITLKDGTIDGLEIDVDAHEAFVGGLVGYFWRSDNGHNVQNVHISNIDFDVTTDYLGETRVGGMVGTSQSPNTKYTDCSVSGKIVERCSDPANPVNYHAKVGGFVARTYEYAQQTYTNCVADVDITASNIAGGFVGNHNSYVSYVNCEARGDVTAATAGGFAGRLTEHGYTTDVTFDGCSASGVVTGTDVAGGFIGSTANHGWAAWTAGNGTAYGKNVTIKDCTASSNVTSDTEYCAGIIGEFKLAEGKTLTLENVSYSVEPPYYPTEVAQIGDVKYWTLADAIAAANATENGATITLLTDATVGEMMTISKDVIIEGDGKTITWADGYNGTIFNVESGVSVTLKDLTIDGENSFTFYDDTTTVENGQNWYTRFVDVGEEDKAINDNVIVNAGDLTLNGVTITGVTIASDGDNGKTANTETGGFYLMYNDDLALIKSNGGKVTINGGAIMYNAGMVLNAINAETSLNTNVMYNMGAGNKGGIIIANGGTMDIKGVITYNKAMARSATILGVINGTEVTFDAVMNYNEHIGVGSNTAGAMIVLEGASQFVMNGGTINYNEGGRAGAIASRWVGGSHGQHEDTSIVLNAGSIIGNTASNDSWNGASIFLRSPATIGEGMTIDGTIAVNAAPGALEITGGTFNNFDMIVTDGLVAEITGGTFDSDPTEWVAEGYEAADNGDGTYSVTLAKLAKVEVELMPGVWGTSYITVENWADLVAALGENTNLPIKVTLLKDIKLTDEGRLTIAGTAKKVIDLNGHTITGMLVNYAELIVNDETQNGKIEGGLVAIDNYGALTVNGGFFTGEYGAIYNNELQSGKATVVIYGGEFTALGAWYATIENQYGVLTVNGGKIVATNGGGYAIVDTCGETTINGGEIVSADGIAVETYAGKIIINDGSFVGKVIVENQAGNVTVYGGTLVSNTPEYYYGMTNANGGVTVLYGGTYERDYATAEGTSVKIAEGYTSVANGENFTVVPGSENVLEIWDVDDLMTFAALANSGNNFSGWTVDLMADIDLGGMTWTPIASFAGNFVGNNHIISNFHIDATSASGGFFNVIASSNGLEDVKVKDLILSDVTATVGNARFGTLANSIQGVVHNVTVKNITVTTTHTNAWVGGMAAFMSWPWMTNCTVENLVVDATAGADLIGGFACILQKNSNHVFDNLDVKGFKVTVTDTDASGCGVGGFVAQTQRGWENPKIINSDITGIDITASGLVDVGGFIAWPGAHTIAENCHTSGKIDVTGVTSADCFAGGFFGDLGWNADLGQMGHVVTDCTADVDIITKVASAGGFVGSATNSNNNSMYATFNNCSASGDITAVEGATADIGGFFGDGDRGVYNNCSASGTVTNNGTGYAGQFGGALYDVTPKYDGRYPAGTRDYLVDEITLDGCYYTGVSDLKFIGNMADGVDVTIIECVATVTDADGNVSYYTTLQDAFAAAVDGDVITLLKDVTLSETVLTKTEGAITLDLGGYTITTENEINPAIRVLTDLTVKNGTMDTEAYCFIVGGTVDDTAVAGNLTIVDGTYHGGTSVASVTKGTLTVLGGDFSVEPYEGSYDYTLNCIDANYKDGTASIVVKGGTFYKFNPENNAAEGAGTDFVPETHISVDNGDDTYTVINYIQWIKDQLLAGNDVTLDRDIIVDGSMIESIPAPTNGNGKYPNYGIFNVVGDYDVTFDLNGHSITYNGHESFEWNGKTYNSCTVAHGLFFANDGAHLTIVGEGDVIVYGVASGVYSASPDTAITIQGGNWVNNGCAECGATNLFLYASHGGELYIEGGSFEQALDSEGNSYLIVVHGGEYKNSVIDFAKTKIVVTGGTFVGMDPSKAHYFQQTADNKLAMGETTDTVTEGFKAVDNGDGTWTVKPVITVKFDDITIVNGNKLPEFTYTTDFGDVAEDGLLLVVGKPEVVLNGVGTYEITADAYVFMNDEYAVEVIPGTLTVQKAIVKVVANGQTTFYADFDEAWNAGLAATGYVNYVILDNITLNKTYVFDDPNGGTLEMNDGMKYTINSTHDGPLFKLEKCIFAVKNIIIDAQGDAFYVNGGSLTIQGVGDLSQRTIIKSQTGNAVYLRGGNVTVKGGVTLTAYGDYPAIQGNGNYAGNVTISKWGGYVGVPNVSAPNSDMAIYWPQNGTLTISDGVISGKTAVWAKSGTINISGGTFIATGDKVAYAPNNNGATATGDAVVIEASANSAYELPVVSITGGTFQSANGEAVAYYTEGESKLADENFITGGTFSSDVSDLCEIGYGAEPQADGTYVVKPMIVITVDDLNMVAGNQMPELTYSVEYFNWTDVTVTLKDLSVATDGKTAGVFDINCTPDAIDGYYVKVVPGTLTVEEAVAQVGTTYYASLMDAFNACTDGETVILLVDLVYGEDDVVAAIGGATGFGDYYNPAINYVGGTRVDNVNSPSNVNAVLDLNGHTITNNADAYLFLFMDNCRITVKDSKDGDGMISNTEYPLIWVVGTETLVTIENGKYTTEGTSGLIHVTHGGDLVINGGEFKTTADDASYLIVRHDKDRQNSKYFISGKATVTVYGGTFYGFDPENTPDDYENSAPFFNAVAEGYMSYEIEENVWTVIPADTVVKVMTEGSDEAKFFNSIAAAMAEAQKTTGKDTVYLIKDHTESVVLVYDGVVLDVQDKTLTADYLVVFKGGYLTGKSYSATRASGTIKIDKNRVIIAEGCYADATSALLPIWNQATSSYVFGRYLIKNDPAEDSKLGAKVDENGNLTVDFKAQVNGSTATFMTGDTYENHGVSFRVVAEWTANGVKTIKSYVFTDEMVQECFGGNKSFRFTLAGAAAIENLTVKLQVVSDTGSVVEVIQTLPESSNQ